MKHPRFQAFQFKNGKIAKNRVVVPPMASQTADTNGYVTETTLEHYTRLAEARAGIIFVEYSFIHQSGKGEPKQLGVSSWTHVEGLSKVADSIHASGALAGLQLVHVGGKTSSELTGFALMGPSPSPVPVRGWEPETPVAMDELQIASWTDWFLAAARRAEAAGFDIVELHAAHGYGLNQWLSPLTNHRKDNFGGSIEGRSRLLINIVQRIKRELPGLLLAVRLPAQDHAPGGLGVAEMVWVAQQLELAGLDLLDVSSGIGGWKRTDGRTGQGYLVEDAAALKFHLTIPVIGVGGIESGDYIDYALDSGKVDFAAVGRALLKNPLEWGQHNIRREEYEKSLDDNNGPTHFQCSTDATNC